MTGEVYDEADVLREYILHNYGYLMTDIERLARRAIAVDVKSAGRPDRLTKMVEAKWGRRDNPDVQAALSGGVTDFERAVVARILSEHESDVFINRCPECDRILRTPRAKMCVWCGNSWHNTDGTSGE